MTTSLRLVPAIHRSTHRIGLSLAGLRDYKLSQGEAHILAFLAESAPAAVGDAHKALAHKRSTLTSILDRLSERRLITRETGAEDRRTFVIDLTPEGRRVAADVLKHLRKLEQIVAKQFSAKEVSSCLQILQTIEETASRRN